ARDEAAPAFADLLQVDALPRRLPRALVLDDDALDVVVPALDVDGQRRVGLLLGRRRVGEVAGRLVTAAAPSSTAATPTAAAGLLRRGAERGAQVGRVVGGVERDVGLQAGCLAPVAGRLVLVALAELHRGEVAPQGRAHLRAALVGATRL